MILITQWIVGHHNSRPDRKIELHYDPTRRIRHQIIAVHPPFERWRSPTEDAKGTENYTRTIEILKARGWTITDEENLASNNYIVRRYRFLGTFPNYLNAFKIYRAEKEIA